MSDDGVKVREREWTEGRITLYQAKAQGRSGLIYERTIAESVWGPSRGKVYEEVRVAAEVDAGGRRLAGIETKKAPPG